MFSDDGENIMAVNGDVSRTYYNESFVFKNTMYYCRHAFGVFSSRNRNDFSRVFLSRVKTQSRPANDPRD